MLKKYVKITLRSCKQKWSRLSWHFLWHFEWKLRLVEVEFLLSYKVSIQTLRIMYLFLERTELNEKIHILNARFLRLRSWAAFVEASKLWWEFSPHLKWTCFNKKFRKILKNENFGHEEGDSVGISRSASWN